MVSYTHKKYSVKLLSSSLGLSCLFMVLFELRKNIILISIAGFLFSSTLPFANTSLDILIRKNISKELQGRALGLIRFIIQLGYILAYASVGFLSDSIFTPMLIKNGVLINTLGKIIGIGSNHGSALLIIIAGELLCLTLFILYNIKSVRKLEDVNTL